MSKIGKQPVHIKEGVTVSFEHDTITVSGPKGTLSCKVPSQIQVRQENSKLLVAPKEQKNTVIVRRELKGLNALYGVVRATLANMVTGVSSGFQKKLELSGVGYRAQVSGSDLTLSLGFSHPIKIKAHPGVTFQVVENTIVVSGVNKGIVGEIAAQIRSIRPPEPYKGKGISYVGERVRRKAGKAAKAVGGK